MEADILDRLLDVSYLIGNNRMMYKEETYNTYKYYLSIPGVEQTDLDIKLLVEADFITIVIDILKGNNFVEKGEVRIVKLIGDIKHNSEINATVERGVLQIILHKANAVTEYTL
ncbi:MAG: hypothetical protein GY775_19450 [Candidatus Scalindua sp.]|nr:hypothetical protein [Candidatus Scalindua sp.]